MTLQTQVVLKVLLDDPTRDHYGLEVASAAELKSGTLYPILARLEKAGWITSSWEDIDESAEGRRRRRYYRLTATGESEARAAVADALARITPTPRPADNLA